MYDVVVVGAGTAGAVLAERLSRNPDRSVLLLESGTDVRSEEVPDSIKSLNFWQAYKEAGWHWAGLTASNAVGVEPQSYLQGRGVGGSSSINGMLAIRGLPEDYESWAVDAGCEGWAWQDMRAAFASIENDIQYGVNESREWSGRLPLNRMPTAELSPYQRAAWGAVDRLGYSTAHPNYNDEASTGMSLGALTVLDGRRISTNDGFLEPARDRPNLAVRGESTAEHVVVERGRAVGVVTTSGALFEGTEIVLCAGAIGSPTILLRSDLGASSGLPIGENLMEHPGAPLSLELNDWAKEPDSAVPPARSLLRYSSDLCGSGRNDMTILFNSPFGTGSRALSRGFMLPSVFQVFSRGSVALDPSNPSSLPRVDLRMLSDERDLVRLRDGVRRAQALLADPSLAAVVRNARAGAVTVQELRTDDDVDDWLLRDVVTYHHASGTCRMGRPGDPRAVVDPECRVIGLEGLRVGDASVIPDIPRAHTYLTTAAIGARLATLLAI